MIERGLAIKSGTAVKLTLISWLLDYAELKWIRLNEESFLKISPRNLIPSHSHSVSVGLDSFTFLTLITGLDFLADLVIFN